MKPSREKCPIMCKVAATGLVPSSAMDAEMIDAYPRGAEVEVTVKQRRSIPQLRAYWAGLRQVVEACDSYPTVDSLHDAIKMALRYTTPVMTFEGKFIHIPDSVAIGKMDAAEFGEFFKRAERLIAERFGFNPWARENAA